MYLGKNFAAFLVCYLCSIGFASAEVLDVAGDDEAYDWFGTDVAVGDFNGDGFDDLAIGVPGQDSQTGAVNILYGGNGRRRKLGTSGQQYITESAVSATAAPYNYFGTALAVGNFNGDQYDDLAVGVPYKNVGSTKTSAGTVIVIHGSSSGLNISTAKEWSQDTNGIIDDAESYDYFGRSLAAGDFDHDGNDDLAVGVPNEDTLAGSNTGAINIIFGTSANGLDAARNQFIARAVGIARGGELFGSALTTGDYDNDGHDELAVGIPYYSNLQYVFPGTVLVFRGLAGGLEATGTEWHQDIDGVAGERDHSEYFGRSLSSGDTDGDGYEDLVIGVPGDTGALSSRGYVGALNVLRGSSSGLSVLNNKIVYQAQDERNAPTTVYENMGSSVTAGDFNGDGRSDVATGLPYETVNTKFYAGAVQIFYGQNTGIEEYGNQLFHQDTSGVEDEVDIGDRFGQSVASGDFNRDGYDDLVVGVPFEATAGNTVTNAGVVHVFYGTSSALQTRNNQLIMQ